MAKILDTNINDSQHYNALWERRDFKLDYSEPIRTNKLLEKFNGGRFIDLGCGVSTNCEVVKSNGEEIWAMDISDKLIKSLRHRFPEINYFAGSVLDIPIKDNYFDYAVAGELLEHIENPKMALKEIMRILKPGGILAVSVPNNDMGGYAKEWHLWSFTEEELRELLKEFGAVSIELLNENNHKYGHLIGFLTKNDNLDKPR